MNDGVRQELVRIVARHGRSLIDDPRKTEALLRDYCGQHKREINVLVGALKERVPANLISSSTAIPGEVLLDRLVRRLQEDLGLSEEASRWAVESWALALGVDTAATPRNHPHTQAAPGARRSTHPDDPFIQEAPTAPAPTPPEEVLRQALRIVFADNIATEYEKSDLQRIRQRLAVPVDVASRIFAEVKAEKQQSNSTAKAAAPSAKDLIVSKERGSRFRSIGQAVNAAAPGSHIIVRPGVYRESLIIDRPLRISGDGAREEIVVESSGSPCLATRAASMEIRGLTLRSFVEDDPNSYFAVDISHGRALLENCDIASDAGACISIHGLEARPVVRGCRVQGGHNYGIWIWDEAGGEIEACEVINSGGAGIIISGDTLEEARQMAAYILADISGSRDAIERASATAVGAGPGGAGQAGLPKISRCSVFAGVDKGIWVHYKGSCLIEHCRVFENGTAGVWVDEGSDAAVRHCSINRNGWEGVRVTGNSSATVEDCDLSNNGNGAWAVEQGCRVRQSGNKV